VSSYLNTLRPSEKRLVVGIAVVFIVVLNFWFVTPHFSDLQDVRFRMQKAKDKLATYENEKTQIPTLEKQVRALESEGGASVPVEDQALHFANLIQSQAGQSRVVIVNNSPISTDTNSPFFMEKSQSISVQGGEPELVDFLYSLGSGESVIRVRDLSLHPDAPHQQLVAGVKLVASYQKNLKKNPPATPPSKNANLTAKRP
jgi:Tfp pilus assembly protein PilO